MITVPRTFLLKHLRNFFFHSETLLHEAKYSQSNENGFHYIFHRDKIDSLIYLFFNYEIKNLLFLSSIFYPFRNDIR